MQRAVLTESLTMPRAVHGEGADLVATLHELGMVCKANGDLEAAARHLTDLDHDESARREPPDEGTRKDLYSWNRLMGNFVIWRMYAPMPCHALARLPGSWRVSIPQLHTTGGCFFDVSPQAADAGTVFRESLGLRSFLESSQLDVIYVGISCQRSCKPS